MSKPDILITNDDGIDSPYLSLLVKAFEADGYTVFVAAPKQEHSWTGRALSRFRQVNLEQRNERVWAIDGTPSDCVNIALGHLVKEKPALIVSGINSGYNTSLPYITASGTVAGALEGALWEIPAMAYSYQLMESLKEKPNISNWTKEEIKQVETVAQRAVQLAHERLNSPGTKDIEVHSINFPFNTTATTPVIRTKLNTPKVRSYFKKEKEGHYNFDLPGIAAHMQAPKETTDLHALMSGNISYCILNFSALG